MKTLTITMIILEFFCIVITQMYDLAVVVIGIIAILCGLAWKIKEANASSINAN